MALSEAGFVDDALSLIRDHWGVSIIIAIAALLVGWLITMYIVDKTQKTHAIRRNFPIYGRLRYFFESLGEYFRQYFFANDREELPFNRATRAWVYRTSKDIGGMTGFGSTNDLKQPGSIIFATDAFPLLEEEYEPTPSLTIGPRCENPFEARSIFNISGMSFGAISKPAVQALSRGAGKAGIWMNTGEGGLSPYHLEGECDIIYQIGTAKYGVRDHDGNLSEERLREVAKHVKAFELKLSQGAKPGRGGVLPGNKVTPEISLIRGIPVGKVSSSPNRHREISSVGELLGMLNYIREVTGRPVGFKSVMGSENFPRELCEEIHRRGLDYAPDFITVDGGEGGTGAAPQLLLDHAGMTISEALPLVADTLIEYDIRDHIRIIASGKLVHSAKVAWALGIGADFVTSARGFMFSLGCIQSLQCHKDTCPTGITTHNKRRQKGLVVSDKAERVKQYAHWVNHEVDVLAHSCGLPNARHCRRDHIRLVLNPGHSKSLAELYPYPSIKYPLVRKTA